MCACIRIKASRTCSRAGVRHSFARSESSSGAPTVGAVFPQTAVAARSSAGSFRQTVPNWIRPNDGGIRDHLRSNRSRAVGGFYGAKLAQAGSDVHFLFRDDAEYVRTNGLDVRSVDGDFVLEDVSAHEEWSTLPEVDVVIVAVKQTRMPTLRRGSLRSCDPAALCC